MEPMYYIGLDVHKRKISYCVKDSGGKIYSEGSLSATRLDLDHWMKSSGNTVQRTPLSKQRNKHLQTTLIEAAKMAPRYSSDLAMLYDKEKQKGNANRATLAVARKLVAYLMAVDRGQRNFQVVETNCIAA
jgi:trans-2-enoyl-CoA reductase